MGEFNEKPPVTSVRLQVRPSKPIVPDRPDAVTHCRDRELSKGPGGSSMQTWLSNAWSKGCSALNKAIAAVGLLLVSGSAVLAQSHEAGGEANLKLPDLSKVSFLGVNGHKLLLFGLLVCVFGLLFGLALYQPLQNP